ncbi:protein-glutamate O-methyltransferase CheR [Egibacter rhizosphaerae]|uniref:protein-glutamate O-methyltransferase n=1 Tax=Egibacter rhizosphaerae TaxID=1670831 RepID=A0A411YJ02_9ACTN|nr:protein-glutamate O-methyltransferase CheR [Egibacter rhizosphaerae]QBI21258.1 protein-glutamate O-methyltransferase CheR [Egibacter rhizosphaerae]
MSLAPADFDYVRTLVRDEAAIVVEPGKSYLVESRLAPVARRHGLQTIDRLVQQLRRGSPRLRDEVVEAMTTNETSFFRDVHPFTSLEERVIPELMQRRAARRQLVFWSAACSSGQEPYSVAMLLREKFPQLASWNVRIVASDISAEMLGRAAAGRFSQLEVNRGLPARYLAKYFQREGAEWQISDEIRRMVEFRAVNLIQPWPRMPPVDVLLLRNVLIYFDHGTKREILARCRQTLQPDGFLFLGAPETTLNVDPAFDRVQHGQTICYQLKSATGTGQGCTK